MDHRLSHNEIIKKIEEKKIEYDGNKNGDVSVGKILDGIIHDVKEVRDANRTENIEGLVEFVEEQMGD